MTYDEVIHYLFTSTPLFQNVGASAYKEGLANTKALDAHFGYPHRKYKTIHIAGTNGKGSCAHTLASILQAAGYKTGLYTSPHLVDFRERIRINGKMIPKSEVIDFVEKERYFFEPLHPSFFELSTALAFDYFARNNVDVAVIEVGLGGRLDCTNIIRSDLSVITNISYDHTQFLGDTLEKIAAEKAGIIKKGIPVVIGEAEGAVRAVFAAKALAENAPIIFAQERRSVFSSHSDPESGGRVYDTALFPTPLRGELGGEYQERNMNTILCAVGLLNARGFRISEQDVRRGVMNVCEATGLKGRWEIISQHPEIIIDTGHNPAGIACNMHQLAETKAVHKRIVVGMVSDKDVESSLRLMPRDAIFYFTKASVRRALDENVLRSKALALGLSGNSYPTVGSAVSAAVGEATADDVVYIGGSNFVVGDFLKYYDKQP